jgi:hypothetical protein
MKPAAGAIGVGCHGFSLAFLQRACFPCSYNKYPLDEEEVGTTIPLSRSKLSILEEHVYV